MGKDIIGFLKRKKKERSVVKSEIKKNCTKQESLELNMLLLTHSLEKGLSMEQIKQGFGLEKAEKLIENLEIYANNKFDFNNYVFIESLSVLKEYLKFSANNNVSVEKIVQRQQKLEKNIKFESIAAGTKDLSSTTKMYAKLNYDAIRQFMESRHSIRSYKMKPISDEIMKDVVTMTGYAPSACNRQPSKVYWTTDLEKVQKVNKLIPGNKGFEDAVPNWAIITTNKNMFNKEENFQWYVNGGIFLSYFVWALHANGIGSCIFQIPVTHDNTLKIREIFGISDSEAVIAAVGFGYAKEMIKVLQASRRPVDEISIKI